MKMTLKHREFKGTVYHESQEIPTSKASLITKISFIMFFVFLFGGIMMAMLSDASLFQCIFPALGGCFISLSICFLSVMKKKLAEHIGNIFIVLGILLIAGPLLFSLAERYLGFGLTLILSVIFFLAAIFLIPGIWMLIHGILSKTMAANKNTALVKVSAVCDHLEQIQTIVPGTRSQTEVLSDQRKVPVERPVWRYEYNGTEYLAAPPHYTGGLNIKPGDTNEFFIDCNDPAHFIEPKSTASNTFIGIGIAFIICFMFCILLGGFLFIQILNVAAHIIHL